MKDADAYLLIAEEGRRYRAYVKSLDEDSRRPQVVAAKRKAWLQVYAPLRAELGPNRWRDLLRAASGTTTPRHKTVSPKRPRSKDLLTRANG